jgi:hypothetical protein
VSTERRLNALLHGRHCGLPAHGLLWHSFSAVDHLRYRLGVPGPGLFEGGRINLAHEETRGSARNGCGGPAYGAGLFVQAVSRQGQRGGLAAACHRGLVFALLLADCQSAEAKGEKSANARSLDRRIVGTSPTKLPL